MDALWKWMMRANAAAVLYCGLVLLALQLSWWAWKESRPVALDAPPAATRPRSELEGPLGLKAFIETAAVAPGISTGNPFLNPRPDRPPVVRPPPPPPSTPETVTVIPRPPTPPPPPRRETVRLTYKGLFQNSGAESRALIEDSKRRRSSFYRIGEVLFGMKIRDIRMLEVSLLPADGSDVTLKLGEPYEFEERPHGY
jgi:hypothetical protein